MAANLVSKVRDALKEFPLEVAYCWLTSSVALHWIKGVGNYKQFISNRVRKIQEKEYIQWRDVGSKETPADLGSRDGEISKGSDGGMGHRGFRTKTDGQKILLPPLLTKHKPKPRS